MGEIKQKLKRIFCSHTFYQHEVEESSHTLEGNRVFYKINFRCRECGKVIRFFWLDYELQVIPKKSCDECDFYDIGFMEYCQLYRRPIDPNNTLKVDIPEWCVFNNKKD